MIKILLKSIKEEITKMLSLSSLKKQAKELVKGITKRDILLMAIFPAIIFLIMLLPNVIRENLQLEIKNPEWWQYLTQSFVHNGWKHFWSNLSSYFLFSIVGLLLANLCGEKKKFFRLFLFAVVTLPILSSIIQVMFYPTLLSWLPNLQHSQGSSGIVSALAGFVPIFWAIYFNKRNKKINFDVRTPLVLAIYIASLFVYIYSQKFSYILLLIPLLLVIFLILLWSNFRYILFEIAKEIKINLLKAFILITSFLFFIVTPIIIFPSLNKMFDGGTFTDFFMHYVGVYYGIIVSGYYFIFIYKKWK
ncbi:rhomboid family intramembrane serine protease [Candidatus Pacearchaeota archaeon]|nr:rhomboid family intramembrane serine protease [Candidatus Pacearchaeota archaeon]MBI2056701.1 rhomboid family intramembrane serine protease [Candidatus Pacearchaeota archaeon]